MMHRLSLCLLCALLLVALSGRGASGQSSPWYTQGNFVPRQRVVVELTNELDIDRVNVPVVIRRGEFPIQDLHELQLTVVDPVGTPNGAPSPERVKLGGGHELQQETNGHILLQQMDDLDKDGVWDELFFTVDIKAHATKRLDVYVGMNQRGWNPHETHAAIGSYVRHLMPFWESKNIGWKLWFPTSVDVYAKRKPMLMANRLYMDNLDGYAVSLVDPAMGSDIQSVDSSFGAGAICLFETPSKPDEVSSPRFTPARALAGVKENFNAGQIGDTRYAFDVVVNGPVRSMIRVRTMNWNTGKGSYEAEQIYTAYANQSYSTCQVRFPRFLPGQAGVHPGAGIRRKPQEQHFFQQGGVVITAGPETVMDPDAGTVSSRVEMIGSALVVKDHYRPEYQFVPGFNGNHTFRVTPNPDGSFEYLIAGAWSEGAVLRTYDGFVQYVRQTAREYASPLRVRCESVELRD
jgi:hypothetical protein